MFCQFIKFINFWGGAHKLSIFRHGNPIIKSFGGKSNEQFKLLPHSQCGQLGETETGSR